METLRRDYIVDGMWMLPDYSVRKIKNSIRILNGNTGDYSIYTPEQLNNPTKKEEKVNKVGLYYMYYYAWNPQVLSMEKINTMDVKNYNIVKTPENKKSKIIDKIEKQLEKLRKLI